MRTSRARGEFSSFLYDNFTDTELRSITYSILGPGAYERLHGANKLAKVTSLLEFLESANRIGELIQEVQELKPDIDLPRAIIEDELEPPQQSPRESQPSKVESIEEQRGQARSTPPEFADKMRQRRPGYDRAFELTQQYFELSPDERDACVKVTCSTASYAPCLRLLAGGP